LPQACAHRLHEMHAWPSASPWLRSRCASFPFTLVWFPSNTRRRLRSDC